VKKSFSTKTMVDSVATECSSTTPHLGGREEGGGTGNTRRNLSSGGSMSGGRQNFPALMGSHHHQGGQAGLWDLTNSELGYELAASSGMGKEIK
jgi:hypothetical protein